MNGNAQPRELPRDVLIMGDGQLGVLVAIALKRALPTSIVTVVPGPLNPGSFADHIGTALPFTNRLHDRLGIEEFDLIQKAGASHRLVTRYREWAGVGQETLCGYGGGAPNLGNAFTGQFAGVRDGQSDAQSVRSPAIALAATGRFCTPDGNPGSPLASIDYALRWNVAAYRDVLIEQAMRLGVHYVPHSAVDVLRHEDGRLSALVVEGRADALPAGLFLDCSGVDRWLISKMEGVQFDSWGAILPARGIVLAESGEAVLALEDRLTLMPFGWLQESGGRDGVHRIFAFAGGVDDTDVMAQLEASGVRAMAGSVVEAGALANPFVGNVIALGDAAASFEPLGGANLDLAHRQLSLLLELLPGRVIEPHERDEFNRRAGLMADAMRDWLASHFAAPGIVPDTPLGKMVARLERSSTLMRLLDQHGRNGRLPFFEEAPMLPQEWSAMLRALGVEASPSVHTLAQSPDQIRAMMQETEMAERAAVNAAPPYGEWLSSVLAQQG